LTKATAQAPGREGGAGLLGGRIALSGGVTFTAPSMTVRRPGLARSLPPRRPSIPLKPPTGAAGSACASQKRR